MTEPVINGVATFSDLSINKTGAGYTLNATDGGLTPAASGSFNITPAVANHLVFSVEPTSTVAGQVAATSDAVAELTDGLDIWLYLLRHAEKMDLAALPPVIEQSALARRALEELRMLTQTDLERERYEARRKAQLDYNSGINAARRQGRQEGREEGEKIGMIHLCERMLNRPETPTEQLAALSPDALARLADDLPAQLPKLS